MNQMNVTLRSELFKFSTFHEGLYLAGSVWQGCQIGREFVMWAIFHSIRLNRTLTHPQLVK